MNPSASESTHQAALTVIRTLDELKNIPKHKDRVPFLRQLSMELIGQNSSPTLPIHTRDLSATGMSFVCRRSLRPGERFVVKLPYRNLPGKLALCLVKHCAYAAKGLYYVDVSFDEVLTLQNANTRAPDPWLLRAKQPH